MQRILESRKALEYLMLNIMNDVSLTATATPNELKCSELYSALPE